MPNPTPIVPYSGSTARAVRLASEAEVFVGISVGEPWTDELNPTAPVVTGRGAGRITVTGSPGASLTSGNCYAEFNFDCFQGGFVSYRIEALSASTYRVVRVSDSVVMGAASYAASATGNSAPVKGLTFFVTSTSMTTGHTKVFAVDGPIGFKKASTVAIVKLDNVSGTITHNGNKYRVVSAANAYNEGARHVYVEAELAYAELPTGVDFRQMTVHTGLVRAGGVGAGVLALLPNQVDKSGYVEAVFNRNFVLRNTGERQFVRFLLEF